MEIELCRLSASIETKKKAPVQKTEAFILEL